MVTDKLVVGLLERLKLREYRQKSSLMRMLYIMYRLEMNFPQILKWLQSLFRYFDDDLERQHSLLSFKTFKNNIKMINRLRERYQVFLANLAYLLQSGLSHIPCPVCSSLYCKHFDSDYLEYDCRDNQTIAANLHMYYL